MSTTKVSRIRTKPRGEELPTVNSTTAPIDDLLPKGELKNLTATDLGMTQVEAEFFKKYKIELSQAPAPVVLINTRMLDYCSKMGPNVAIYSPEQGAQNQLHLFQTFMRALSLTGNDLFMGVDLVTAHVRENLGTVFSSRLVYRFIKNIRRDENEVNSFLKLLEIFLLISDPEKRNEVISRGIVRSTVAAIDPRYKDAAFSLVTYLSQEHA